MKMTVLPALLCSAITLCAQSDGSARFEVISIKRNLDTSGLNPMRIWPDGSVEFLNMTVRELLIGAAPSPVTDVEGLPTWGAKERYDISARAQDGTDRRLAGAMLWNLLIDRMKLSGHFEERENNTFAMVLAHEDGRLGPELRPSIADCERRPNDAPIPVPPTDPDFENGCATRAGGGLLQSGAITMGALALSLRGLVGRFVNDRTGLAGRYRLRLTFTPPQAAVSSDDRPDIFTALQEQLGLKLVPEKTMQPVFVVDHIERPTEN